MAKATALIRISLPACEKNFPYHCCTFLLTFSLITRKVCCLFLPTRVGSPRYKSWGLAESRPNYFCRTARFSSVTFGLKEMEDFCKFILWPDVSSYPRKMSLTFLHSSTSALQKTKLSSAKKRWLTFGRFLEQAKPVIAPEFSSSLIRVDNPSAHNKKR